MDGYNKEKKLGIEFHGCYFHACQECYPDDQTKLAHGRTAGSIWEKNAERIEFLESQLNRLEVYYECAIRRMLEENEEMKEFFDNYIDCGPIRFREGFSGGRTGPMKIYHSVKPGEKISYKDVRSLYPKTNFFTSYPTAHPKPEHFKYSDQFVNWTKPSDNPYKGMLKVLIVPPKNLRVPVLPAKFDGDERLLFPLCKHVPKNTQKEQDSTIMNADILKRNDNLF